MRALSKKLNGQVLSAICAAPLLLSSAFAFAEDAPAAAAAEPAPPYSITFNLGVTSNYMSRGVNNSEGPAIQGGVDWSHSSGFYLGAWFSSTNRFNLGGSGTSFATNSEGNQLETDWYGGYSHAFGPVTLGVGGNYVWYPEGEDSYHDNNQDTFEGNVNVSAYGLTYTFYHAFTDWYGIGRTKGGGFTPSAPDIHGDTSGAQYHELKYGYTLPFADLNLTAKVGYQRSSRICLNQKDWAIGLNRNFSLPTGGKPLEGFNAGAMYTNTFGEEQCSKDSLYWTDDNGVVTNDGRITFFIKRTW